jgi:hypothetical protein
MEDVSLTVKIDDSRSLRIAPLPLRTYREAGGKGLGGELGYFIYEIDETQPNLGIEIIGKAASMDAAIRIYKLLSRVTNLSNRRDLLQLPGTADVAHEPFEGRAGHSQGKPSKARRSSKHDREPHAIAGVSRRPRASWTRQKL